MAIVASPSQVLSLLGSGIVGVLNWNSVRNGISSHERELRVLLWVHVRLRGEDDGRVIFEFDTRTLWMLKVTVGRGGRGGDMVLV